MVHAVSRLSLSVVCLLLCEDGLPLKPYGDMGRDTNGRSKGRVLTEWRFGGGLVMGASRKVMGI